MMSTMRCREPGGSVQVAIERPHGLGRGAWIIRPTTKDSYGLTCIACYSRGHDWDGISATAAAWSILACSRSGGLPDIDAIGFFSGVEYGSRLGHRGLTHSFAFAAV